MQNSPYTNNQDDFEEKEIDLRSYLKIVRERRTIIVSVLVVVLLITIVATYTTTPIFTAASQVLVERNRGKSALVSNYYYYEPDFLSTQSEIIRSENVALKVVNQLQLATKYKGYFFKESSESFFLVGVIKEKIGDLRESISSLVGGSEKKNGSSSSLASINFEPKSDAEIIADIIRAGLNVVPVKDTKIVTISYKDKDPSIAKLVADAVVKAYMNEMLDIKLSTNSYSLKWMTEKAAEERDKLERSEKSLQTFMRANDLVTVENRLTILPQKLSEFGSQLSKAEAEKKELQDLLNQVTSAGKDTEKLEKITMFASEAVLQNIRERLYKANQNIQELSKKYGKKHPVMIRAKDELRILKEERRFEIDRVVSTIANSYELAGAKEKNMYDLLMKTKSEMLDLNEKFMQYSIMKRDVDSNRILYDTLQTSIKKQGVTEQSQSVNIWVIKKAGLPVVPSKPNKKRNLLLGLLLGLFSGIGLAFFVEYLDNTLKSARQIEDRFGLTVLGSIEELKEKGKSIDTYINDNLLSPLAESYRLIRSALLLSTADQPPKVVLITSMSKSEGKTATGINLARLIARDKKSVVVIDCDLRRPRMHSLLGMENETGLSSYLAGHTDECPVFKIPGEEISLVTSGPIPPDPSELLGSARMPLVIGELLTKFDFVLLDSPPIGAVTDSLTLSQYVDGTILVVKAGATTNEIFESGLRKMNDINARILGVVVNRVKALDQNAYQYGYSSYYAKDDD
jgi:succinoglycan biosynthesis transport protein ExoP